MGSGTMYPIKRTDLIELTSVLLLLIDHVCYVTQSFTMNNEVIGVDLGGKTHFLKRGNKVQV